MSSLVELTRALEAGGLDLCAWVPVQTYNAAVPEEYALPDLGRDRTPCVVVGNSRALWTPLLDWLLARGEIPEDPVERYVESVVLRAIGRLGVRAEVRWATDPPPRRVAIQRLAHLAGLAHLGPANLTVHPEVGPWMALRAAVVLDMDPPGAPAGPAPDPCTACEQPCMEALQRAIEATGDGRPRDVWERWLEVRDVCPAGRDARYGEQQIRYHHALDLRALEAALEAVPEDRSKS